MIKTNELKEKMINTFKDLKSLNGHNKISDIFFNYKKTHSEFENLSKKSTNIELFKTSIKNAFLKLKKWKEEIELPENIKLNIEQQENDIGNNTITILLTLNNIDEKCEIHEILFQYSINTLNDTMGVSVLFLNTSGYNEEFVLSEEISSELILKEIVDTFYNYVKNICIE
ncbi:MAG: hypothetical protein PHV37_06625 [Candidatus Gastranaerophilales bacterium]|nr:hypothetical protein [Candidatus Gastranaerophilales bacterium]